ncbi:MAG: folate family ECF transporter S component [Christensenella sp.]|nr:folate family ECF transporter S component [Christensenella sp.]
MAKIAPKTLRLVYCAVFLAIGVVLSFLSFYLTEDIKISFAPIAVMLAGATIGPLGGIAVGALTDILVLLIKSLPGPYFPGFTITMALYGLLAGIFFYHSKDRRRQDKIWYIAVCVAIIQTICSLLINSAWNNMLFGPSYGVVLATRAPTTYIQCAVYIVILAVLIRNKQKIFKTLYE